MPSPLVYVAAAVLVLHGIVHLLGTGVYLGGFELEAFAYKTTLLAGAVDVGDLGMRLFGLLWGIASLGFAASAAAMLLDWQHWQLLLGGVTVLSLVLTGLDIDIAYAGFGVNLAIIAALVALPRL
jgi:hypothetical protein